MKLDLKAEFNRAPELAMAAAALSGVALGIWILATSDGFSLTLTATAIVLTLAAGGMAALASIGFQTANKTLRSLKRENERMADRLWEASETEERATGLFEQLGDLVVTLDARRTIIDANSHFCRACGLPSGALAGKTLRALGISVPRPRARASAMPVEVEIAGRWYSWIELPVAGSGEHRAWRGVARDIHEHKAGEAQLIEARERAEAANKAKSSFLATVSHEIRTPLNGINGMAKLLADTSLTDEQRTYVQAVTASGNALLALIEDLLDFSKIETGRLDLRPETLELRPFCEGLVELVASRAHAKGLGMACHIAPQAPHSLLTDPNRLRQALLNLLGNAVKFTSAGGVMLEVGAGSGFVSFTVRDSGNGIAEEDQKRIFEEFEQVDSGATRAQGGVGLGLSITRRLITAMGGSVKVESLPGKGAAFEIDLPNLTPTLEARPRRLAGVSCHLALRSGLEAEALAATIRANGGAATHFEAGKSPAPGDILLADAGTLADRRAELAASAFSRRIVLIEPGERGGLAGFQSLGFESFLVRPVRAASLVRLLAGSPKTRSKGARPQAAAAGRTAARALNVLVAEDNEVNALLVKSALSRAGHVVTVVGDGRSAIAETMKARHTPDIVLMDLHMPVMDGLDAIAAIRTAEDEKGRSHVPILALTADGQDSVASSVKAVGGDGTITKPVDPARLVWLVEEAASAA